MNRPASLKNLSHFYVSHITAFEVAVMERFCLLRGWPWLTWTFKTASRLGDGSLWIATGIFLFTFNHDNSRLVALAALLAVGASILLFMCLKNVIGRPRPFESWQALTCMMAPPDKFSFPSGHTMTAFAVWGVLFVGLPSLSHIYLVIAVLIGLSRIFLGLHYPSDVLVGAVLGGGIGLGFAHYLM
ncbi:MAG: phosphatase PAP2 family protein [Desulfuromonadales bacterium]